MLDLSLAELSGLLGHRSAALDARRWFYTANTAPHDLPEALAGIAAPRWQALRRAAPLPTWRPAREARSADGTVKFVLEFQGASVETVLIPSRGRSTVCVSSQAGCSRQCVFCATARLGFTRPLDAGEILMQYAVAAAKAPETAPARNVVFMGMGEPLDNLDAVLTAVERLLEPGGPQLGAGHVTVSTSGVLPGMQRFLRESRAHLALSLNGTTDPQRERLMPHTRRWPIRDLLEALRVDARSRSSRRYFIEYVLCRDVNDSVADAERLVRLLEGLPAHVNLIPHNPFPENPLRPPSPAAVERFQRLVADRGVRCLVRPVRGGEIAAACGQLALSDAATAGR